MQSVEARFWAKVERTPGCWLWTGAIQKQWGYGLFKLDGKNCLAHRVAYGLAHGGEAPTLLRHRCDIPSCVRPDHLLPGTNLDNARDCVERGRRPRGEALPNAKLTEEQVAAIRAAPLKRGGRYQNRVTAASLAAQFGVSPGTIDSVRRKINWRHV